MGFDLSLADRMRRTGLKVVEVDGWRTRGYGNAATFRPKGSLNHRTIGAATGNMPSLAVLINGRGGPNPLPGPLSQIGRARDRTIYVIAAGRANHAGAGFWQGLKSNSDLIGVEVEGTFDEPITVQEVADLAIIHAELARGRWDAGMVAQHYEYALPAGRKSDMHGLDGGQFRGYVASQLATPAPPQEDDMKARLYRLADGPKVWCVSAAGRLHIQTQEAVDLLVIGGMAEPVQVLPAAQAPALLGVPEIPGTVALSAQDIADLAAQIHVPGLSADDVAKVAAAVVDAFGAVFKRG